jgi:hypothetical protein
MQKSEGGHSQRRWQAYMDVAATCLQNASRNDEGEAGRCARQLLQMPSAWRSWELEFGSSLRTVSRSRHRVLQIRGLRQSCFSWIHLAAPFKHIRDRRLRGEPRRRLVLGLHNQYSFSRAVVAEHGIYLRSTCHSLCSAHLGATVLGDALFAESMRRYETVYMEYFQAYCAASFPLRAADAGPYRDLLPLLKLQVSELRQAILDHPSRADWLQHEADLRRPTGDTQRMRRFEHD